MAQPTPTRLTEIAEQIRRAPTARTQASPCLHEYKTAIVYLTDHIEADDLVAEAHRLAES